MHKSLSKGVIANEMKQSHEIATFFAYSLEDKLELLFSNGFSPLLALVFFAEFEPKLLIKMTCRIETFEGPKIDSAMLLLPAKFDRFVKKPASNTMPLVLGCDDEPSQMGTLAIAMNPVNGNGANNFTFNACYPKAIMGCVKAPEKL